MRSCCGVPVGILILALVSPAPVAAQDDQPNLRDTSGFSLDFSGYIRAGLGLRDDGGEQECFQLPGARAKYRLGNECEIYFEPGLRAVFGNPERGPSFSVNLRGSLIATPINAYDDVDTFTEEAWIGVETLGGSGDVAVWAGQRFYKRQDIYINDFYWWDGTGLGAGVEGIPAGPGTAALAVFTGSGGNLAAARDDTDYTRVDLRLGDVAWGDRTTLTFGLDARFPQDGADTQNDGGALATIQIGRDLREAGSLTVGLQAARAAARTFSFDSDATAPDDAYALRTVATHLWNATDRFAIQSALVAEYQSDADDWYSLGARPVFGLGGNLYLAVEGGLDYVVPEDGGARSLGKLTAALEWKPGPAFFDRPAFRLYATAAAWDDAAEAAGIAPDFAGNNGLNVGVQVEHFW